MNRLQLIREITEDNPHLYQNDILRLVLTVFEEIAAALERGDRVELRGFGAFSVTHRKGRIGRNPRTGDQVTVRPKAFAMFRTGKCLHDQLNGTGKE